jgi:AraC family transcriptional regulator, arabinose operon regulatory protein
MTRFMDYMISPYPIRIVDLKVDKSKLLLPSLIIANVGHLPGRTLQRKNATFEKWAIVYITGGKGTYQIDNQAVHPVESGNLFLLYPHTTFHYGPENGGYWDEYYFTLEGDRVQEWIEHGKLPLDTLLHVGVDDAQIHKIEHIFTLIESGVPANNDRASLMLESLMLEFMLHAAGAPESNRTSQIINLMDDISNSLYQPLETEQLAKRHHISHSTLRRIVSEYTGYPLNEYIHRLKMAEAKKILLNTELAIKEISDALGYKDVFYFSRLFKKYVGASPLIYRKNM